MFTAGWHRLMGGDGDDSGCLEGMRHGARGNLLLEIPSKADKQTQHGLKLFYDQTQETILKVVSWVCFLKLA